MWKCFLVVPLPLAERSLRRYSKSFGKDVCAGAWSYHNASRVIETDVPFDEVWFGRGDSTAGGWDRKDPRWPTKCDRCSYQFTDEDNWQVNLTKIFEGADVVIRRPLEEMPPGAVWLIEKDSPLADVCMGEPGPDGKHLFCKLPGGTQWQVDGPSWNNGQRGPGWTRTGTVPDTLSVTPSINVPGVYHGFLGTAGTPPGHLSDDLEGRKFDAEGKPA